MQKFGSLKRNRVLTNISEFPSVLKQSHSDFFHSIANRGAAVIDFFNKIRPSINGKPLSDHFTHEESKFYYQHQILILI